MKNSFLTLFKQLLHNNLISSKQSVVKPGDSCINQLISITHVFFNGFDDGLGVRGVFLNISKTKYGMGDLFKNYVVMVFVTIYYNY